jgi:Fe-Mn family superoxide dismutase
MKKTSLYILPPLPYGYGELIPFLSEEQLRIHHDKHHTAYVTEANNLLEKLNKARQDKKELDMKGILKSLSFNVGGHILHSLFWKNLAPPKKLTDPQGNLLKLIEDEFGSFERFKEEFSQSAASVEGSGWAALSLCNQTRRPLVTQIEKHNVNLYPEFKILMVIDVFEHAYYLDYKNDRKKWIDAFWNIINWEQVSKRLAL